MKILLPFKKELNPYLEEIIDNSIHEFTYDHYLKYDPSYDFVHIHWPEALFDWNEPSSKELDELEVILREWKRKSILIYTKHDFQRNKGTTKNFSKLFLLIEKYSDVFIHLGEFSKNIYRDRYPLARHEIIYHPLYTHNFKLANKIEARKLLGISEDDFVIIAPGTIRNYAERDMLLNAFEAIKQKNKVLIVTNMHAELRYEFPGRVKLKRLIDVKNLLIERFKKTHQPPKYIFTYNTVTKKELELKMSAADLVLISRKNTLNSGNVFLGLTFNKILVGPAIGNIEEQLKELGLPLFNPKKRKSILKAIRLGRELTTTHNSYLAEKLEKYLPVNVAKKMDDLLSDLK